MGTGSALAEFALEKPRLILGCTPLRLSTVMAHYVLRPPQARCAPDKGLLSDDLDDPAYLCRCSIVGC